MTILPNTNKKNVGCTKGPTAAGNSSSCSNVEVENAHHSGQHSHPITLPTSQADNLTLGADRVFGSNLSSGSSLWSHSQSLSLSHGLTLTNSREDTRSSQPLYDLEPGCSHGKRRHRQSPIRTMRNKRRVDRDRSNTASPNASASPATVSVPVEAVGASAKSTAGSSAEANGCNSEDEYESRPQNQMTEEELNERERRFEKKLRKKGLIIKSMGEDGACLFRAVADQVYGDQDMHSVVRRHCMDYVAKNRDYFSQYVTEDFNHYVSRKRLEHVHGNHIEIQALSEMYNRTIEVFCYSTEPINTFHGTPQTDNAPIRLSYHKGIHYNSLVDPYKPTVGVGLGLPGHIPGSADKNLLNEAAIQSEQVQIEQAMLEDKVRATDWEATSEAMEEQIARESYLQWLKDNERRNRVARSPNASSSSATATAVPPSAAEMRSPRPRSHAGSLSPLGSPFRGDVSFRNSPSRLSPPPSVPGSSRGACSVIPAPSPTLGATSLSVSPPGSPEHAFQLLETPTFINQLPPEMFGMTEWEDAGIIAQVLAASQQEYLDTLKKVHEHPAPGSAPQEPAEDPKTVDPLPELKKPDASN